MTGPHRNVVVTGASSGLGRAVALWFAARGDVVWAVARRETQLRSLAEQAAAGPGRVIPLPLDISDIAQLRDRMLELDSSTAGGIDLVIANAGIAADDDPHRDTWEQVARMIEVNIAGAAATLATLAPRMAQRQRGHLVGVSSMAAWLPSPIMITYSATKAFIEAYCAGLRQSLAPRGVHVTCLHPGFVKTEMTANNRFRMPFLLDVEDAADRAARAIVRRKSTYAFPWQMAALTRVLAVLPEPLLARLLR